MFFPPSLGVSVIIHLVIIVYHKLFHRVQAKYHMVGEKSLFVMRGMGVAVVFMVSSVILAGAFNLVELSIMEKHSSVHLVSSYINKATVAISNINFNKVFASGGSVLPVKTKVTPKDCPMPFGVMASWYGGSLVDFLNAKGYDSSFSARERYAREFNMGEYHGTFDENQTMLMDFFVKLGQLPPVGSSACSSVVFTSMA